MTKDSKLSSTPFDLYDIFGYIVPGMIFLLITIYIINLFYIDLPVKLNIFKFIHDLKVNDLTNFKDIPWWLETTFFISTIIIVYITGHLIASISSLLVDKFLVKKVAGYPSYRLFNIKFNVDFSVGFYKLLFFLINIYLLRLMFWNKPTETEKLIVWCFFLIFILIKMIFSTYYIRNNRQITKVLDRVGNIMAKPFNFLLIFL